MSKPTFAHLISAALLASTALLAGCHGDKTPAKAADSTSLTQPPAAADSNKPAARIDNVIIAHDDLYRPLVEAYGLNMLLNVMQLDMAKDIAARSKITVKPEDVQAERDRTLAKMFADAQKEDYDNLFNQFLNQQHLSRTEFDIVLETNTYLRKIAEPQLPGKITEDTVRSAFNQLYGENRQIRDIELANLREWNEAKKRVDAGEPFEQVAKLMSHDRRNAGSGGEWPPFSSPSTQIPEAIKTITFKLKQDEVSSAPIEVDRTYHLIKLIRIIAPKVIKYEDVKESVRTQLNEQWIEYAMKELRNQLGSIALRDMQILDPVLKAQFDEKTKQQTSKLRDRDEIRNRLTKERNSATTEPTTTTAPTTEAVRNPAERPPATMPAAK